MTTVMTMQQRLIEELAREATSTRRVLERLPEEKLSWAPHPKSLTLGQLAQHIAALQGAIAKLLAEEETEVRDVPLPEAKSVSELLAMLDESVATGTSLLESWGEDGLLAEWRLKVGDRTVTSMPRIEGVRTIMMNHLYHHRGQLTVYLRLLGVPLPAVYGDSADERALSPQGP